MAAAERQIHTSLVPLYLLENSTRYKPDIAVDTADSASRAARIWVIFLRLALILSAIPVRVVIIIRIIRLRMNATSA